MSGSRYFAHAGAGVAVFITAWLGIATAVAAAAPGDIERTRTTVALSATSVHTFEPVTATATVVGIGEAIPSGTVDFTRGKKALCSGVTLDTSTSTASCDLPLGKLGVTAVPVTATYVPSDASIFRASNGAAGLTVTKWTPDVVATAVRNGGNCTNGHLLRFTVSAPADAAAAVKAGLPTPSGVILGPLTGEFTVHLSDAGTGQTCQPVFGSEEVFTYSGDTNFASVDGHIAIRQPDTAPHGGGVGPPHHGHHGHKHPSTAPHGGNTPGGVAETGPRAAVGPALWLGSGLVLLGLVLTLAGRQLRWSKHDV